MQFWAKHETDFPYLAWAAPYFLAVTATVIRIDLGDEDPLLALDTEEGGGDEGGALRGTSNALVPAGAEAFPPSSAPHSTGDAVDPSEQSSNSVREPELQELDREEYTPEDEAIDVAMEGDAIFDDVYYADPESDFDNEANKWIVDDFLGSSDSDFWDDE